MAKKKAEEDTEPMPAGITKQAALEIYKHIRDELEAATNPGLIPQRLHELKTKLHTLVSDLEQEVALDTEAQTQTE